MKLLQKKQQLPARRNGTSVREKRASAESLDERYSFRRNRTLTGSLSSEVTSAGERHAELRSPRMQAHDLRHHRRRLFWLWIVTSGVAAILGYILFESIAIPHVVIVDATNNTTNTATYEKAIQRYLNAHFFERSRLTLNTTALTTYLQENGTTEVSKVEPNLSFYGFGSTTISIVMRQPVVSWKTGTTQLYVDENGAAFTKNYFAEPTVSVVDQTGIPTQNNRILASNRFLGFVGRVIGRLKGQGYQVTQVVLPANTTRQLQLSINGLAYPIKFSVDRPAAAQAEDAARAIRYLASKGIMPEYLDVRVSGRAYYK